MAECIGFRNMTSKDDFIKYSVFYCFFFQTALIPLLAPLNVVGPKHFLNGVYTDLNQEWFAEVGSIIIGTMTFNIFWPLVEFTLFYCIRHVQRMFD